MNDCVYLATMNDYDKYKEETSAVLHDVCLSVFLRLTNSLRQAL